MYPIRLENTAFEGENNAYLVETGPNGPTVLIDTGIATPTAREELESGLADHGVGFADVDAVLLTHFHYDHSGLAGAIQAESDATVYAHEADAPLVGGDDDAYDAFERRQRDCFDRWGIPDDSREELLAFFETNEGVRGEPTRVEPFADGAAFEFGTAALTAVHLPGHTAGHCGFAIELDGETVLASGDALLPKYTPNVGGADVRVDDALATYLRTLGRIVDGGYARAWPGHRDSIEDPVARAVEIADHHRERTERVVEALDALGSADAWTVGAELFGALQGIHILHGPGEAYAHLEHLETHGVVERDEGVYRLCVDEVDLDGLFPSFDSA